MLRLFTRLALDAVLIAILIWGGIRLHSATSERTELQKEYNELAGIVGQLEITDPDKIHWVRLDSEDPAIWRYRIYLPTDIQVVWRTVQGRFDEDMQSVGGGGSSGSGSSGPRSVPEEMIVTAGIIDGPRGPVIVFDRAGGSTRFGASSWESLDTDDPNTFRVETPEVGIQQTVGTDGEFRILKVTASEPDSRYSEKDKNVYQGFEVKLDVTGLEPFLTAEPLEQ